MQKMIKCLLLPLLSLWLPAPHGTGGMCEPPQNDGWEWVSGEGTQKLYKRPREGSPYQEIRIEDVLEAEAEDVLAMMLDVEGYKDWIYKCTVAEKLASISNHEFVYYTVANMPFPLADRDVVANARHWENEGTLYFQSVGGVSGYKEEQDGMVRVQEFVSTWEIKPLGGGKVGVANQIHMDPGGNVPVWAVNMTVTKGPKQTMKELQKLLRK